MAVPAEKGSRLLLLQTAFVAERSPRIDPPPPPPLHAQQLTSYSTEASPILIGLQLSWPHTKVISKSREASQNSNHHLCDDARAPVRFIRNSGGEQLAARLKSFAIGPFFFLVCLISFFFFSFFFGLGDGHRRRCR